MRSGTNARFIEHIDADSRTRLAYSAFDLHGGSRDEFITITADLTTRPRRVVDLARDFLKDTGASPATELRGALLLPPASGTNGFRGVDEAIEALRSLPTMPGPVIAVAGDPGAWRGGRGLRHIDGFVAARPGAERQTVDSLGTLLGALAAPTMISCVDDGDLLTATGTAERPSRLVEATWRAQTLEIAPEDDEALRSARVICLVPVVRLLRMDDYRAMGSAVRTRAPAADLFSIVTVEFFEATDNDASDRPGIRTLALCR